ncbi:hypothetical protein [Litoreibacter roseus]|nr:hypothetical protein [Litoreibacter roseus]
MTKITPNRRTILSGAAATFLTGISGLVKPARAHGLALTRTMRGV